MKIAIANQLEVREFARDDEIYVAALKRQCEHVDIVAWDDASVDWSIYGVESLR